jgi:predicted negative regulator of RcsB-dependent stress response
MSSGAQAGLYITLSVLVVIGGTTAIIVWSWHRLQAHRADAVAMASYRKLAEEAVANQAELRDEIRKLNDKVSAVEQLMRDVG